MLKLPDVLLSVGVLGALLCCGGSARTSETTPNLLT